MSPADQFILGLCLTMMAATAAYGIFLYVKYTGTSRDDAAVAMTVFGAIGMFFWPIMLPLLVWAHVRYAREASS